MQTTELLTIRPFHESIVDAILSCHPHPSEWQIWILLELIRRTKIPKGHDEIITAINLYFDRDEMAASWKFDGRIGATKISLLAQKQEALSKSDDEKKKEFFHRATIRERVSDNYHPEYNLFDSDTDACHWLIAEGWQQILVNGPHRTFTKELGGKKRTVEVVKLDFEPLHVLSQSYWNGQPS